MYQALWKGFRFGALLQAAVGPVCLFIFQTAASSGFLAGEAAVLGVTLADSLYIAAAILGIGTLIEQRPSAKNIFKYLGAAVIVLFGASSILSACGINIIPGFGMPGRGNADSAFLKALFLTLSSPLTIVFWAGIFSAKAANDGMKGRDLFNFGLGAILSTIVFMSIAAIAGTLTGNFLPSSVVVVLNIAVGLALIFIGIKTAFRN
ncbi:MAG: LysE family translocator [Synergistaceae bacterium]|nr:LysE family translocator [Synergistaceae bacterium]